MCFSSAACFPLIPLFNSEGMFSPGLPSTSTLQLSSQGSRSSNQCFQSFLHLLLTGGSGSTQEQGAGLSLWDWEGFITALLTLAFGREFPHLQDFQLEEKSLSWHSAMIQIHFITNPFTAAHNFWDCFSPFFPLFLCGHIGVQVLKVCIQDKNHPHFSSINIGTSEWKCKY